MQTIKKKNNINRIRKWRKYVDIQYKDEKNCKFLNKLHEVFKPWFRRYKTVFSSQNMNWFILIKIRKNLTYKQK